MSVTRASALPSGDPRVERAYDRCEEITRSEARNFAYGIRLLPAPQRRAMSALYAVARRIDDIGDGEQPPTVKAHALSQVHQDLDAIETGDAAAGDDPVLIALADALRRYPIPLTALHELVDGCQMDVDGVTYQRFEDLVVYCRRVAGTVGRLSLGVYGCTQRDRAEPLADALGVALQITNILRDIVEDRDTMGRVYLPSEDLARFGVDAEVRGPTDSLLALVTFEAGRAEEFYDEGLALLPLLDRRSRACTAAMAGIYRQLLTRIQRNPAGVFEGRMSLRAHEKARVAWRGLTRGTI